VVATRGSLLSVADRIAKAAVVVVAVWHRWPVRNGTTELYTTFKTDIAFIVARTLLYCPQIIWMLQSTSSYISTVQLGIENCFLSVPFCIKVHIKFLSNFPTAILLSGRVNHVVKCKQYNKRSKSAACFSVGFLLFSISDYNLFVAPFNNGVSFIFCIQLNGLTH
jgi:hypothetical protein